MATFFIIDQDSSNEPFGFNFRADSTSEVILKSEGYTSKQNAKKGIESVKIHAPHDSNYDRLRSSDQKYYFNLKAGNSEIISTSKLYDTNSDREAGIDFVKRNAPGANIDDLT